MRLKSRASTDFTANTFDHMNFRREGLASLFDRLHSVGSIRAIPCVGESRGKKQIDPAFEISQLNRPRIPFKRFSSCWFLYAGKAWPVKDCPVSVFKAVLHYAIKNESIQELMGKSPDLDLVTRWYICCEVQSLRLFESEEKALHALKLNLRV